MRFYATLFLSALFAFASAQSNPNPFNVPNGGYQVTAGQTVTLTWQPTTSGTVSLVLRSGNAANLEQGTPIATSIANSGTYSWAVPGDITQGSDYTVEILSDADPSQNNYTPYFVLNSDVTVASSTALYTSGAPTSAIPASRVLLFTSPLVSPSNAPIVSIASTGIVLITTTSSASAGVVTSTVMSIPTTPVTSTVVAGTTSSVPAALVTSTVTSLPTTAETSTVSPGTISTSVATLVTSTVTSIPTTPATSIVNGGTTSSAAVPLATSIVTSGATLPAASSAAVSTLASSVVATTTVAASGVASSTRAAFTGGAVAPKKAESMLAAVVAVAFGVSFVL